MTDPTKSLQKNVSDLQRKLDAEKSYLESVERIQGKFLDLQIFPGRRGGGKLWADSALPFCTDFDTHYTCGCCVDAGYCVTPFVEVEGKKVYGWVPNMELGKGKYDSFRLYKNWKERLPEGIPKDLRERIENHLKYKEHEAKSVEEDDELSNLD